MKTLFFSAFDFKAMPPCQKVLRNKIKRTNYITRLIKNADKNFVEEQDPCINGWFKNGCQFDIEFFHGDQCPENLASEAVDEAEFANLNEPDESDTIDVDFSSDSDADFEEDED